MFYKQVTLTKGTTSEVVYIPEQFAHVGKFLRINEDNGWQVVAVAGLRRDEDNLIKFEREYLNHRKVTDI